MIIKIIEKNKIVVFISLVLLLLLISGSYALFKLNLNGTKVNKIVVGNLQLALSNENANGINIENAIPVSEKEGLKTSEYKFTLKNTGTMNSAYTVYLDDTELGENEVRMLDKYVRYYLEKDGEIVANNLLDTTNVNNNRVLDSGSLIKGRECEYSLKVWIDSEADNGVMDTVFKTKIRIEAIQEDPEKIEEINLNLAAENYQLDLENEQAENYEFEIENPEIATVDENGEMSLLTEGTVNVTITNKISGVRKTKRVVIKSANINVVYNYATNGGISSTKTEDALAYGSTPDLSPVATPKEGYDFIGWNTDKNATEALDETTVTQLTNDITLYAIYKKKSQITLEEKTSVYTGNEIKANTANVVGPQNSTVTYKYYTDSNCSEETTQETGASNIGEAPINAGIYYVIATTPGNTEYNYASTSCIKHTITKANSSIELSTTEEDIAYATSTATFNIKSNTSGGNLLVTDDNETTNVSINNNVVTISNLKTLIEGTEVIVTVTSEETSNYNVASATYKLKIYMPPFTGIASKSYQKGETVSYAGQNWEVINDNGSNTTLVLAGNYTTGIYGNSINFTSGNNAYDSVNTSFVNANKTILDDINYGGILYDNDSSSYVRIPKNSELSSYIQNSSGTNFWTMNSTGNNIYYGVPTGGNTYTSYGYDTTGRINVYRGYSNDSNGLDSRSIDKSVYSSSVSNPSTSYNSKTALGSYSPYTSMVGKWSTTKTDLTPSNSYNLDSTVYLYNSSASGGCSLNGINSSNICSYSCGSGTNGVDHSFSKSGSTSNLNYCSIDGNSSTTYTTPDVTVSATGVIEWSFIYTKNANFNEVTDAYGASTKKYYCDTVTQADSSSANYYFKCNSNCSNTAYGSPIYYATANNCDTQYDYYVGENKYSMGIRPVVTVKEK